MSQLAVTDSRLLFLNPDDNVCTAISPISRGITIRIKGYAVVVKENIPLGFKLASRIIATGETIVKYGVPIGTATQDIAQGELVHIHNLKSSYLPTYTLGKVDGHE